MDLLNEVSRLKSIAIVGGTFNPVHKGHIMLGELALKTLPFLDYVVYMPNNKPVYKVIGKPTNDKSFTDYNIEEV